MTKKLTYDQEYYLKHRAKKIKNAKEWAKKNKKKLRKYRKTYNVTYNLRSYNLTLKEYNCLLKNQKYKCKICKRKQGKIKTHNDKFVVDHDHKTGQVRGLLCRQCNCGIGLLSTVKLLYKAAEYLNRSKSNAKRI